MYNCMTGRRAQVWHMPINQQSYVQKQIKEKDNKQLSSLKTWESVVLFFRDSGAAAAFVLYKEEEIYIILRINQIILIINEH